MSGSNPNNRNALWNSLLDADMNVFYWAMVSGRYGTWDKLIKIVVAVAASGAVAAWGVWSRHPEAWKIFSGVACIASIGQTVFCSPERLQRMAGLVATWKELRIDYELLWQSDSALQSRSSWDEFQAARRREAKVDETGLPTNDKLIRKAYDEVCRKRGLNARREKN